MNYQEFLQSKTKRQRDYGIVVSKEQINSMLFDFQKDIVKWAVRKGRCAIFLDTGLGKTFCQFVLDRFTASSFNHWIELRGLSKSLTYDHLGF